MSNSAMEQSIFGDMSGLEKNLAEDITGDRARSLVKYFRTLTEGTERMLSTAKEENQRHLVSRLTQGFQAAERIVRQVWETIHGSMLVL